MYSAFISPAVYTFIGGKSLFLPHSGIIHEGEMTLFHRYIHNRNKLFHYLLLL